MKTYLLASDTHRNFYYARRTEEQVKPDAVKDMKVGECRGAYMLDPTLPRDHYIIRES